MPKAISSKNSTPSFSYLIEKKRDGGEYTDDEVRFLVDSILDEEQINLIGRGNQLLHWIKSNKHCGYCGALKEFNLSEEAMFCKCNGLMIYPTISPCVLSLIIKDDKILLARNALFPEGLYSALAGFIEVSETAEETLKREVFEEVSLKVKNIYAEIYYALEWWNW